MAQYPDKVTKSEYLELAKKDERGVPRSTGVHIVTLLRSELFTKNDEYHRNEEGMNLYFDEDGIEKKYFISTYVTDRNSPNFGKFHYLYQKFADIEEDTILEMEYIKKGIRGYVDVRLHVSPGERKINNDEIPVIEDNKKVNHATEEEYDSESFQEKLKT